MHYNLLFIFPYYTLGSLFFLGGGVDWGYCLPLNSLLRTRDNPPPPPCRAPRVNDISKSYSISYIKHLSEVGPYLMGGNLLVMFYLLPFMPAKIEYISMKKRIRERKNVSVCRRQIQCFLADAKWRGGIPPRHYLLEQAVVNKNRAFSILLQSD